MCALDLDWFQPILKILLCCHLGLIINTPDYYQSSPYHKHLKAVKKFMSVIKKYLVSIIIRDNIRETERTDD